MAIDNAGGRPRSHGWANFVPKSYTALTSGYTLATLRADAMAGLTVAIVALPLAMALAIASGATPDKGLLTAAVAGFLISALGGSRFQIGGPTGAFVVVVFNVIQHHGFDGLVLATVMAGLLLLAASLARLGSWIRYIPEPVVSGFTMGIAVVIATGQVGDFLGLTLHHPPADVISRWRVMWEARDSFSLAALALAGASLALILGLRRFAPRAPGFLIAVIAASVAASTLHLPVETIGSRFGQLPAGLPMPHLPAVSWERIQALAPSALTIAFLAGIESLLSAMVADGMTGRRHRSNGELLAQGVANLASGLFGGMPATGAIARTATNIRAGGKTPVAGMLHALFVGGFLAAGAPLAGHVPLACLAAILMVVAWSMSEPHKALRMLRAPLGDRLILVTTFALTVLVDLSVAIGVGVVMAAMVFMHRMAEASGLEAVDEEDDDLDAVRPPAGVEVFQLRGPLFFGAAYGLSEVLQTIGAAPRVFILRMDLTTVIDFTGAGVLGDFLERYRHAGSRVILCGVRPQPREVLERLGLGPGADHFSYAETYGEALALAA